MTEDEMRNEDIYIYLDFNGKMPREVFENPVFLQILNLHKQNPIVQVNENVFKGSFDHALGTNIFFQENQNKGKQDLFDRKSSRCLEYVLHTSKVLNLKMVKIRPRKADIPNETRKIEYNFDWDYNTLLEKFAARTLNIRDIVKTDTESQNRQEVKVVEQEPESDSSQTEEIQTDYVTDVSEIEKIDKDKAVDNIGVSLSTLILENDYKHLQNLAHRPVRREKVEEAIEKCDPKYQESYEYHNLERQILQPSHTFRKEDVLDINENTLANCVDINRCVSLGLLKPSRDLPRILTSSEKQAVLTLDNFDNLSLAARYYVLNTQVEDLEKYLKTLPEDQLNEKDVFGKTPLQTLRIYGKLRDAVKKRISELRSFYAEEELNQK